MSYKFVKCKSSKVIGYCRRKHSTASIQILGTDTVINQVPSEDLAPIMSFSGCSIVCHDLWVGVIKVVNHKLTVRLTDDGSVCTIKNHHICYLQKKMDSWRTPATSFFKGQVVYASGKVFDMNAEWIGPKSETTRPAEVEMVVEDILTTVKVEWFARAFSENDPVGPLKPPTHFVGDDMHKLKLLSYFDRCTLSEQQKYHYVIKPTDEFVAKAEWDREEKIKTDLSDLRAKRVVKRCNMLAMGMYGGYHSPSSQSETDEAVFPTTSPKKARLELTVPTVEDPKTAPDLANKPEGKVMVNCLSVQTAMDIVWQDGSVELGIPVHALTVSGGFLVDIDFFPGNFVVENNEKASAEVYGVVQKMDPSAMTVVVKWFNTDTAIGIPNFVMENEASAYDLKYHPVFAGLKPEAVVSRKVGLCGGDETGTFGEVIDSYPDGKIQVAWVEGHMSKCWPQALTQILILDKLTWELPFFLGGGSEGSWVESEGSDYEYDYAATYEYEGENSGLPDISFPNVSLEAPSESVTARCEETIHSLEAPSESAIAKCEETIHSLEAPSESAIAKCEETIHSLEAPSESAIAKCEETIHSLEAPSESAIVRCEETIHSLEAPSESAIAKCEETIHSLEAPSESAIAKCEETIHEASDDSVPTSIDNIVNSNEKGVFSMVDLAPSSHEFHRRKFQPVNPKLFLKRVHYEMELLKSSLPLGTWVKAFEDRLDLFSVMIRGSDKTPYEDALFLFDIQLREDYPKSPPIVHYISYSDDQINPNLYKDGKVCVSLLGTWPGQKAEMWSPSSNLLQVIVSIQGLILVSEPFFNEPVFERSKFTAVGMRRSRMYNEKIILKLMQAMIRIAGSPHQIFIEEIKEHLPIYAQKQRQRLDSWFDLTEKYNLGENPQSTSAAPADRLTTDQVAASARDLVGFQLIPASKGFFIAARKGFDSVCSAVENQRQNSPPS